MPRRPVKVTGAPEAPLRAALAALRVRLGVPDGFPAEVLAEAEHAARNPRLPGYDATDIPFVTIDPPGSTDLDQALHLSRTRSGYRVRYAIADVAAFVTPGGPLDRETHRRVTTLYLPDGKAPLHPTTLSEDAASLLPDQPRPAALWTLELDEEGRTTGVDVRRAVVRSRAKLDYATVQKAIDEGTAEENLALLRTIGELRERLEVERGGISLDVPEQEIVEGPGGYELTYRAPLPADGWNAQLSLATGMAAAALMLEHGTGVLRTLPAAPDGAVGRLRHVARALRVEWPHHMPYARLIRSLDPANPRHAAFLQECTTLLRGAGYTVFRDGELPQLTTHAAVAAPYTHCTAPLRRLTDRYATELCLAAVAGEAPPEWALAALAALPKEMAEGTHRANTVERACIDTVEAAILAGHEGEVFEGCVIELENHHGTVHLTTPAVIGRVDGDALPLGEPVSVRLTRADPVTGTVRFAPA